jgi:hypothetical protein
MGTRPELDGNLFPSRSGQIPEGSGLRAQVQRCRRPRREGVPPTSTQVSNSRRSAQESAALRLSCSVSKLRARASPARSSRPEAPGWWRAPANANKSRAGPSPCYIDDEVLAIIQDEEHLFVFRRGHKVASGQRVPPRWWVLPIRPSVTSQQPACTLHALRTIQSVRPIAQDTVAAVALACSAPTPRSGHRAKSLGCVPNCIQPRARANRYEK